MINDGMSLPLTRQVLSGEVSVAQARITQDPRDMVKGIPYADGSTEG
jgi:hypothetical protein